MKRGRAERDEMVWRIELPSFSQRAALLCTVVGVGRRCSVRMRGGTLCSVSCVVTTSKSRQPSFLVGPGDDHS